MKRNSIGAILAASTFGVLLGGCATTVEMGPGYYHYDTGPIAYRTAPAVVYREPTVVYREHAVVYRQPAVVYRSATPAVLYNDHGQ